MLEKFNQKIDTKKNLRDKKELNIYGREKFSPEKAGENVGLLVEEFKNHYSSLGYIEHPPVLISSGIDQSVRFIGSHISVFKPYLSGEKIPDPGFFMRQDCIRTKNADRLLEDDYFPNWGSYFVSLGTLTRPERLMEVCDETFNFFEHRLEISPENIKIRINSSDLDLMAACNKHYGHSNLEIDTKKIEYYRHKIGVEGIAGRNFNIALRDSNSEAYSDVGNIIIYENNQEKLGIEVALGSSTILKQLYGLEHVQDCNPVFELKTDNEAIRRKFEDAIITSAVLFREGLRPFGQHNRNRILKQYVKSLSYFRAKSGMSLDELAGAVSGFETREFSESDERIASVLIEFVKSYENELIVKKDLTESDKKR